MRHHLAYLTAAAAGLWALAVALVLSPHDDYALLVIGLAAAFTAVVGVTLMLRTQNDERQQERAAGYQAGFREGAIENAQAMMQGANVSVMPPPQSQRESTCADPRCDAHDPQA